MRYLSADNRDFFLTLLQQLRKTNWQSPWKQKDVPPRALP